VIAKSYTPVLSAPPILRYIVDIHRSYQFGKKFSQHNPNWAISGKDLELDIQFSEGDLMMIYQF